jgi:tetratricopeptide (TPR) repeat protein
MLKNNIKVFLFVAILLAGVGAVLYKHYNSRPYQLLDEAESLYDDGDIYGAHDKAEEAISLDRFNRKGINMKAKLFVEIRNKEAFDNGTKAMAEADTLVQNGDYIKASELYGKAWRHFIDVGSAAPEYTEAQSQMRQAIAREKAINVEIARQHYNTALRMYRNGEYSQAFAYLEMSPWLTTETDMTGADEQDVRSLRGVVGDIAKLKSDISYTVGLSRYTDLAKNPEHYPASYKNDALYWLQRVNTNDKNYQHAQDMIAELKAMPSLK